MKQKLKVAMIVACLYLVDAGTTNVQWVMFGLGNLVQSIINSAKEMVEAVGTKVNMLNDFLETQKIFQQGEKYYDVLKSVHDVAGGGAKVSKSISLVMEISEIYMDNYRRMLSDENYTPGELAAISSGYTMLIDESSDVLQDLKDMVDVTGMSLSDAGRLAVIENAYRNLMDYRDLVCYYTDKIISVSYLRARKRSDMGRMMSLYGTANERHW